MVSALVMTMLLVAFLPAGSAEPASAPAPEWNVGDQWGYSSKINMDPTDSNISDAIDQVMTLFNGSIEKLVFDASMESYIYVKVVEVTADQYVLTAVFCSKMGVTVDVKVKAMMPVEGIYSVLSEIPEANQTAQVKVDFDYLIYMSNNITLDKNTLAIEEIDSFNEMRMNLDLMVDNTIPKQSLEGTNWNVTYENFDISMDAAVFLNLTLDFSPGLNLYDFPLVLGEEWEAASTATLNGDLSGTIDAQGLPEGAMDEIADSAEEVEFPIDLSDYTGEFGEGLSMTNGTLDEVSEDVNADLECISLLEVADDDVGNGTIQIFVVSVNDGEMKFYYSPDLGFFHGIDATSNLVTDNMGDIGDELPIEIPTGEEAMMTMEYQPASDTAKEIESISGYEVDGVENSDSSDDALPFMFVGVVIVLAALAVVVGVVAYRKLKKSP